MPDDRPQSPTARPAREEWTVPVLDAVTDKPRDLIVAVSGTRVVVVTPPGGGYVVPLRSVRTNIDALAAAHSVAEHRLLRAGRMGES